MNAFDDNESFNNDENSDNSSVVDVSQLISQSQPPAEAEQVKPKQNEPVPVEETPTTALQVDPQPPKQQQIRLVMGESVLRWRAHQKNPSHPLWGTSPSYLLAKQTSKVPNIGVPWEQAQINVSNNPQQAWLTSENKLGTEDTFLAKELQSQDDGSATHIETVAVWDPAKQVYVLEIPQFLATDFVSHGRNDGNDAIEDSRHQNTARSRLDPLAQQRQAELALRRKRKAKQVSTSQSPKPKKQNPALQTTEEPAPIS